jgi:hypothetical protein
MARRLTPRYLPSLDIDAMDDVEVDNLVAGINTAGPNCAIVQMSQPLKDCITALVAKNATLKTSIALVAADRSKLALDLGAEAEDRSDLHNQLRTYATLFTSLAKSPADLVSGGLTPQPPRLPRNTPPTVPEQIEFRAPKKGHGRVRVSVHETGAIKAQYVAQSSPDPYGPTTWSQLGVGLGKTRMVTGTSGTKVWVRFAMVRAGTGPRPPPGGAPRSRMSCPEPLESSRETRRQPRRPAAREPTRHAERHPPPRLDLGRRRAVP